MNLRSTLRVSFCHLKPKGEALMRAGLCRSSFIYSFILWWLVPLPGQVGAKHDRI